MHTQLEMFPVESTEEKRLKTLEKRMGLLFSERAIVEEEIRELKRLNEDLWVIIGKLYERKPPQV